METIIVVVVLVLSVVAKAIFFPPKFPESKTFKCVRCSEISTHSDRTVEAWPWRRGFAKLYCSSCHQKWLQSQPQVKLSVIIGFLKWIA
ncbi:MAG: hypothetical protein ACTFAK_15280 [Candidatus Electronema sp. VV]